MGTKSRIDEQSLNNSCCIAGFSGEYRWLSNFWPAPIHVNDVSYPSGEHAYQAHKTADPVWRERIRMAPTPGQAKRLGRLAPVVPNWDSIKLSVMETLVRQKFSTHEDLRRKLIATWPFELREENNWKDQFWGTCNGIGQNHLGRILMRIRDELRVASATSIGLPGLTRVIHIRESKGSSDEIYIGRAGKGESGIFGNPVRKNAVCPVCGNIHKRGAETLPCYKVYLWKRLKSESSFRNAVRNLLGHTLVCFCKPNPCHGDVLLRAIEWLNRH
ncbi:NADAR domain-containing protein [bacterium]|nr:NADAR domain-containing protein [bacterium]